VEEIVHDVVPVKQVGDCGIEIRLGLHRVVDGKVKDKVFTTNGAVVVFAFVLISTVGVVLCINVVPLGDVVEDQFVLSYTLVPA
jgi:hypothetical protein